MIVEVVVGILLGLGGLACITGAVGLLRFPDVYSRMHASGVTDTLGAGLVVLGLLVWAALGDGGWATALAEGHAEAAKPGLLQSVKLVSILFFLWVSGTTAVHALAKAAWLDGLVPWTRDEEGASSTR
ncbi:MAG: monovalent cation/H(+) antiporter subunit G [Alphaproteobacteria bacterium]|nr:monovalent cation/H(+) antiporter subunit G [Alphaproteobacteria bacterium]